MLGVNTQTFKFVSHALLFNLYKNNFDILLLLLTSLYQKNQVYCNTMKVKYFIYTIINLLANSRELHDKRQANP
jgi:hypothetical protein